MSIGNSYLVGQEEQGFVYFDEDKGYYETTKLGKLVEERDFLEWEISRNKEDLKKVIAKINKLTMGRESEV